MCGAGVRHILLFPLVARCLETIVVLSGFSVRLFCFVMANTLCRYGCMNLFAVLVLVCVDGVVISYA